MSFGRKWSSPRWRAHSPGTGPASAMLWPGSVCANRADTLETTLCVVDWDRSARSVSELRLLLSHAGAYFHIRRAGSSACTSGWTGRPTGRCATAAVGRSQALSHDTILHDPRSILHWLSERVGACILSLERMIRSPQADLDLIGTVCVTVGRPSKSRPCGAKWTRSVSVLPAKLVRDPADRRCESL